MQVIAGVDLWEGQIVRLQQGDFKNRTVYGDWREVGHLLAEGGLTQWHVVDLEGARAGKLTQKSTLKALREAFPSIRMSVGGGVRSDADLSWALEQGFDWIVIGSLAVQNPDLVRMWLSRYGSERFVLAADARGGRIALRGWQEEVALLSHAFIRAWSPTRIAAFLCTQVERDGLLSGPDPAYYERLVGLSGGVPIWASGGIRSREDIEALAKVGVSGVVVGRALYEPTLSRERIKSFLGAN